MALSVYLYNDVIDRDADKNNSVKRIRPLPSNKVTRTNAMRFVYISSIIGLALSLLNNFISFLFLFIFFILFAAYSYPKIHLKKYFLVKETVIVTGFIIVSISVSYAIIGTFSVMAFIGSVFLAIYGFVAMPVGFDSTDIEADKLQGVKTIASVLSLRRRLQLFITGILVIMTLTPFTYISFGYNVILPILMIITGSVFIRFMFPIMRSINPIVTIMDTELLIKMKRIVLIFTLLIAICLVIGSINLNLQLF